jgi:STE24 endopeptidase
VEGALGEVPPDEPRMEAYSHGGYVLSLVDALWGMALLAVIVFSGLGAWLQRRVEGITRRTNLKVALYVALYTVLVFTGTLPLSIYSGFLREKRYGFANQTFLAWMGDQGKGLAVSILLHALFFTLLYIAIRRLDRRWWVAGSALGIACLVLVLAIGPVFIAPLFNTFAPLKDAALRDEILPLAHAQGIPADEVYEVDASLQSEHNNAYVAGLLGTQRIVLYDTLLKRFAPREIRFVMGHEMGHYVLNHVWKFVAFLSVVLVAGFWLIDPVTRRVIAARPSLGIASIAEPASLPLMLLVLNVFMILVSPAVATFSRGMEADADRFGLEVSGDPEAAASSFLKFGRLDLGEYTVHPVIEATLKTHPSLARRIRAAQEYARAHPAPAARDAAPRE